MRGTLPAVARKQLREPFALGVAPACGESTVGGGLRGLQRVVDDLRAGGGEDDQCEARVAVVRLAVDEAHPLERGDLPGNTRRRDAEALSELGAPQLPRGLTAQLAEDRQVGERDAVDGEGVVDVPRQLRPGEREVEERIE